MQRSEVLSFRLAGSLRDAALSSGAALSREDQGALEEVFPRQLELLRDLVRGQTRIELSSSEGVTLRCVVLQEELGENQVLAVGSTTWGVSLSELVQEVADKRKARGRGPLEKILEELEELVPEPVSSRLLWPRRGQDDEDDEEDEDDEDGEYPSVVLHHRFQASSVEEFLEELIRLGQEVLAAHENAWAAYHARMLGQKAHSYRAGVAASRLPPERLRELARTLLLRASRGVKTTGLWSRFFAALADESPEGFRELWRMTHDALLFLRPEPWRDSAGRVSPAEWERYKALRASTDLAEKLCWAILDASARSYEEGVEDPRTLVEHDAREAFAAFLEFDPTPFDGVPSRGDFRSRKGRARWLRRLTEQDRQ